MTPRLLLLQEDQATGGVATISNTLHDALKQRGWSIARSTLNQSQWRQLLAMARHCDVILASHNFRPAYVAWVLGLLLRKPVVVWVHGPLREVLDLARASVLKQIWLRWLYRRIPHFVFVSQDSRISFEAFMRSQGTPGLRASVIPNVVAHHLGCRPPAKSMTDDDDVQLAFIGRLSEEKRPQVLLEVLRLLPNRFKLTLVGDGPLRQEILNQAADLISANRLSLVGEQPHSLELYCGWDLTLLTSSYEGYPICALESLAVGVPCVGLPIAPLQELMGADAPYLLARDHSAQALADTVQAVLALPRHQLQRDIAFVLSRHQVVDFVRGWETALQYSARPC